jgi:hypothetical protein
LNPFSMLRRESYSRMSCVPVPMSMVRIFMIHPEIIVRRMGNPGKIE